MCKYENVQIATRLLKMFWLWTNRPKATSEYYKEPISTFPHFLILTFVFVEDIGVEPMTLPIQIGMHLSNWATTTFKKWRISESNRWPSACKADALANWANPPVMSRPDQIWTGDPYIISVVL